MSDPRQLPLRPDGGRLLDEHLLNGLGDDMPGPNFLAQFRPPMTEAERDEITRALEQAIVEWLAEMEAMFSDDQTQTEAENPSSASASNGV